MNSWITDLVTRMGVWGVGMLMFLENVFPPIPSELIMPLAGYLATQGKISFWPAFVAGSLGSLAGATLWYWVGLRFSTGRFERLIERHGVWLALDVEDFERAREWFARHGGKAVFIGRMIPAVRTLISVPAGLTRMKFLPFLGWTALGTAAWTLLLIYAGRFLGERFDSLERYIDPISYVVLGAMLIWYVTGVTRKLRKRRRESM